MLPYIIVPIIILLLFLIILGFYNQSLNISIYKIKLKEAKKAIKELQKSEINILTKLSKKLKTNKDEKILENIPKINNDQLTIYEVDYILYDLNKEIKEFFEYNKVELDEEITECIKNYKKDRAEIKALKDYYNSNCTLYNEYIRSFKRLLIKIVKKLKKATPFIIKKEVEFEILKKEDNSNN